MFLSPFLKTCVTRIIAVLLSLLILASCGIQNQPVSFSSSKPTPSTTSTSKKNLSQSLTLNQTGLSINKAGLHLDVVDGVQCPLDMPQSSPDNLGQSVFEIGGTANNLVLATNRLTYDSYELQQIKDYLANTGTQVPSTLRWVLGGPIGTGRPFPLTGSPTGYFVGCGFSMQITNTSQSIIQIANVGLKLNAAPQQNTYQYHLIDACTLVRIRCVFGGVPGPCNFSVATIHISQGSANKVFSAAPVAANPSCGELTLNPGEEKGLYVFIASSQNLIYSVTPQFVLSSSEGQSTVTLSEMTSTLALANNSQFTCYGLQGDTFVAESQLPATALCI